MNQRRLGSTTNCSVQHQLTAPGRVPRRDRLAPARFTLSGNRKPVSPLQPQWLHRAPVSPITARTATNMSPPPEQLRIPTIDDLDYRRPLLGHEPQVMTEVLKCRRLRVGPTHRRIPELCQTSSGIVPRMRLPRTRFCRAPNLTTICEAIPPPGITKVAQNSPNRDRLY